MFFSLLNELWVQGDTTLQITRIAHEMPPAPGYERDFSYQGYCDQI